MSPLHGHRDIVVDGVAAAPVGVRPREVARAGLLLGALLLLAYWNVVFRGRSLVYSNNYNPLDPRGSAESYGPGFVRTGRWHGHNLLLYANFHDPGGAWWQWEPGAEFLRQGLMRGELPWWDPYVGAGAPAMANVIPAYFFPPSLLLVLLGNTVLLRNLYYLALLAAAGLFTFLFLRRHGLSFLPSVLGGAVYVFSGALTQNVGSFIGQTAACLPPTLYLTRRFLDRPSWGRTAALAAGYATVSLASFPPVLVALFGFAALYAVGMALAPEAAARAGVGRGRILARFVLAAILALGLVGFYYLPFAALVRAAPHVSEAYHRQGLVSLPLVCLYQLLSPTLAGGSKVHLDPPLADPFYLQLTYVGMMPALLALAARRKGAGWSRAFLPLTVGAAAATALKLFGVQPLQSLGSLPVLEHVHFAPYFGLLLAFLLALLAAVGLETLLRAGITLWRAAALAGIGAVLLASLWQLAERKGSLEHPEATDWLVDWAFLVAVTGVASALLLLLALRRGRERRGRLAWLLVGLFALEAFHNTYYPRQQRWEVWRNPVPYVERLAAEAGMGRVFTADAFNANAGSAFEVFTLDSLSTFNATRVWRLYQRYLSSRTPVFLREARRLPPEGVLDRANIELLALREERTDLVGEAEQRGYPAIFGDGYVRLFRRTGSPRYFFTTEYQVTSGLAALRALGRMPPGREVLLEQAPTFRSRPNSADDPPVVVRAFRRNRYRLSLAAPRPGLVYCAESSMPGWTARVNGRPMAILPANFAFRAVEVPAGAVEIELSYLPPGLPEGLAVSGISGLLTLALVALGRSRAH